MLIRSPIKDELGFDYFDRLISYDRDTGILTWKWVEPISKQDKWRNTTLAGKPINRVWKDGYIYVRHTCELGNLFTGAHQLAFLLEKQEWLPDELEIDHRNGIRSDNRWDNFRFTDRLSNGKNKKMNIANSTGFKGVTRHQKHSHMFSAHITSNYKHHYLGAFATAEDAARAYDAAATFHHGEFAKTNKSLGLL